MDATSSRSFIEEVSLEDAQAGVFPNVAIPHGDVSCLLWGDSHAMALAPGIAAACELHGTKMFMATHSATAPLKNHIGTSKYSLLADSPAFNDAVLRFVRHQACGVVIMAGVWPRYARDPSFEANLRQTIAELAGIGSRVAVVLDVPAYAYSVPHACALADLRGTPLPAGATAQDYELHQGQANKIIEAVCAEFEVATVIDPGVILRDAQGDWRYAVGNTLLYRDNGHLSTEGGSLLQPLFSSLLENG